jgi:hypothetical protein
MGILLTPSRKLRYVNQQIHLYNKRGPNNVGLLRAFLDATQIAIANRDLARARILLSGRCLDRLSSKVTSVSKEYSNYLSYSSNYSSRDE